MPPKKPQRLTTAEGLQLFDAFVHLLVERVHDDVCDWSKTYVNADCTCFRGEALAVYEQLKTKLRPHLADNARG